MARKSRYTDPVQADVPEQVAYQAAQYGRLSVEDGDDSGAYTGGDEGTDPANRDFP